jgi:hypothetical protein
MDPRISLGEALAAIKHQKRQRVIRIVAVLGQKRSAKIALHRDQTKRWLGLVILQPPGSAAAEVAKTVKDDDAVFSFHANSRITAAAASALA